MLIMVVLGSPWQSSELRLYASLQGMLLVPTLLRELRSYMPCTAKEKTGIPNAYRSTAKNKMLSLSSFMYFLKLVLTNHLLFLKLF